MGETPLFSARDLSIFEALQPLLSPNGQKLLELVVTLLQVFGARNQGSNDFAALSNLVQLLTQEE